MVPRLELFSFSSGALRSLGRGEEVPREGFFCPIRGGTICSHDFGERATSRFSGGEGRDAERKHNKSRVARMATRLCYVGEPAGFTPQARYSQTD